MVGRLVYLIDTNVWLELILDQDKAEEVRNFFQSVDHKHLAITEFSLYSIGIILFKLNREEIFREFLNDTLAESGVHKIQLNTQLLAKVPSISNQFNLDFDDSYQYTAASEYGYALISFDKDFDKTELGRKTPSQILE